MALSRARILSSENNASVSQEQNVNIKIAANRTPIQQPQVPVQPQPNVQPIYTIPPNNGSAGIPAYDKTHENVNFTIPQTAGAYQSAAPINNPVQNRTIELDTDDLEIKNKFLEILLSIYETNPTKLNNYIICHSNSLMELIKILTRADKVELIINDDSGCTGCVSNTKYLKIDKILVYKDNQSTELKYGYNNIYCELLKHAISLKLCI